jgi:hypothetical protein
MKGTANRGPKALRVPFPAHGFWRFRAALSIGFSWKSDPLNTSRCDFGIMGDEVNGLYDDS